MSLPDPSHHKDERNWMETVLRYIPGFHGYLEKEYRRESDRLAREWMVGRLRQGKTGLDEVMRTQVDAGQIDALPQWERVRSRLDHFISSLLSAMAGYSGFFDYVRVDEEKLDDVYEVDAKLMEEVDGFSTRLQQLAATSNASTNPAELLTEIEELQQKLARREEILRGLERDDA